MLKEIFNWVETKGEFKQQLVEVVRTSEDLHEVRDDDITDGQTYTCDVDDWVVDEDDDDEDWPEDDDDDDWGQVAEVVDEDNDQ